MGRKLSNGRFTKCYEDKLNKEFLIKEYSKNKKSPYQIASELNISPKTVYNYLEYYNIPKEKRNGEIKPGQNFKLLQTLKIVGKSKNGTNIWLCQCECGNKTKVRTSQLKNKSIVSCGCYRKRKQNHVWKGYCGVSGSRVGEIRYRANKKGLDFNITAKFLWELYIEQDKKCAITGLDIDISSNASLDRISSDKGYTQDNVWWVLKDINKMKLDFDLANFIDLCQKVVNNKENIKWT